MHRLPGPCGARLNTWARSSYFGASAAAGDSLLAAKCFRCAWDFQHRLDSRTWRRESGNFWAAGRGGFACKMSVC
eukprot:2174505-Amphidinium_carterae.1